MASSNQLSAVLEELNIYLQAAAMQLKIRLVILFLQTVRCYAAFHYQIDEISDY